MVLSIGVLRAKKYLLCEEVPKQVSNNVNLENSFSGICLSKRPQSACKLAL